MRILSLGPPNQLVSEFVGISDRLWAIVECFIVLLKEVKDGFRISVAV